LIEAKSSKEATRPEKKEITKPSVGYTIPMRATIKDILRALKILSDKGGRTRFRDISRMFGSKRTHKDILSASLGAGSVFGLIEEHKGKAPYILSKFGTEFLTKPEKQKKAMLLPKFLGFKGYKNVLVQMKNEPGNTLRARFMKSNII